MKKLTFIIIFLLLVGNVFGETYNFTAKATVEWYISISVPVIGISLKKTIDKKTFTISDSISVGESKTFKKEVNNIHINLPTGSININFFTFTAKVSAEKIDENTVKVTITGSTSGILGSNYKVSYSGTVNGQPPDKNYGDTMVWYFSIKNDTTTDSESEASSTTSDTTTSTNSTTKTPIPPLAIVLTLIAISTIVLRKFSKHI